jgi:hypothetical protein
LKENQPTQQEEAILKDGNLQVIKASNPLTYPPAHTTDYVGFTL